MPAWVVLPAVNLLIPSTSLANSPFYNCRNKLGEKN
jgi:hypothetical protein